MERDDVFERVKTIIANVLELEDRDEINLDSSLIDDLGIESVDLVDISVKIEKEFNIEVREGELWSFGRVFTGEGNIKEGRITNRGIKCLREEFPDDDFREVKPRTTIAEMLSLIKVEFIVNYIIRMPQ